LQVNARILIVDDEAAIATTLAFALEAEGFATVHVLLAQEGLRIVRTEHVDLAILDVGLPDMSGFELCKLLRKESTIPVLFLTARTDEIDRVVGLEIGGDDYVSKPFSLREVVARVKVILKRVRPEGSLAASSVAQNSAPNEPSATNGADARWFDIDPDKARIRFLSQPLDLTKSEYLILKGLLRTPERVYSRADIMDFVSSSPASSLERTVDAHVKSIRNKLRAISAEHEPIETHRGLGYSVRNEKA
jgi:two-component system, OmpR family, catabolic regulation response regulator CreB